MQKAGKGGPAVSAAGGVLIRQRDGWRWLDGTTEPRVRDVFLRERAPVFEQQSDASGICVAVPRLWRSSRYWPGGRIDAMVADAIELLIARGGPAVQIDPNPLAVMDDYGLQSMGWLIGLDAWNDAMGGLCGAAWAPEYDEAIRARAQSLRATSA